MEKKTTKISLATDLAKITKLSTEHQLGLKRIGLKTVADLLSYLPVRYAEEGETKSTSELRGGEKVTVYGQLDKLQTKRSFECQEVSF